MQKSLLVAALAVTTALVACGREESPTPNPAAPSAAASNTVNAVADGTTLKATAPEPVSPVNTRLEDKAILTYKAATGKFTQATFTYRVQLMNASNAVVEEAVANGLSYTVKAELEPDKDYRWRVRAEWNGAFGPWSSTVTFRSADIPVGYIAASEIYDPLTDGKSVGVINGRHTFIPGVGVRLEDLTSYIEYKLPQTLVAGEYSAIISNLSTDGQGNKTKVMSMSEGSADIITNVHRMTCEKRNDGTVAWRFIANDQQIDTEGHERVRVDFHESWTYFWRATWNGGAFNLNIRVDNPGGPEIYNYAKTYRGAYDPNPHYVFAGAPVGRSGKEGATCAGMIIRQIWVSARPRPSWANK